MRRPGTILISLLAAQAFALAQAPSSHAGSSGDNPTRATGATFIQVFYYAKPGKAEEVLSVRRHASDVLARLGLPRGRVMRRIGGSSEDPDVLWECEFPSAAALDQFLKDAQASPEFEEVRKQMGALIRKGERRDWEPQEASGQGH